MTRRSSKYGILFIDDEVKALKYFEAIFAGLAPIYLAQSPEEGYRIFCEKHEKIGVIVSDKNMPGESGLDLLARLQDVDPKPLRFLVTAYSDLDVAVDSLNDGLLYAYLTKPWDPVDLEHRLSKALGHFQIERERELLLQERSEVFQQLLMADKAAGIGILAAGLNHHLRNALTVMRTFYDLLPYQLRDEIDGEPKDPTYWGDFYREVGGQIDRMTSILTNLSEGTEMSELNLAEKVDFPRILREAGSLVLGDSSKICVRIHSEPDLPKITGDFQKLFQMARFLFEEARTLMDGEGEIEIRMALAENGQEIETMFIDDSPPLSDAELARLFDPFSVRMNKPEELGINLLACYLTVFQHGGKICAKRTPDGRNSVVFTLPFSPRGDDRDEDSDISAPQILWRLADFSDGDIRSADATLTS